jgi:F-type H+-transporting ATPase subunit delta
VIPEPAARRYAEAAYLLAKENGMLEPWATGLQAMAVLFGDSEAERFLANTRVSTEAKRELIEKALTGVEPQVLSMAILLLRRGRTTLAPQIAQAYQEILDRERGVSHAVVTSAVPLSEGERRAVEEKLRELAGGEVTIETNVDESILGGLVVRIGDRLIDGSTRSRLVALKQRLEGARS